MKLIILFGLPGAGKTFVGEILQKYFDYFLYDDDGAKDMPQELKDAIVQGNATDELRDKFFTNLITSVTELTKQYKKIVVPQTFIKEKYRKQFLEAFPETKFILIQTNTDIREKRLLKRKYGFQLPLDNWRNMAEIFEEPSIEHSAITNNNEGEEEIKQQLEKLLSLRATNGNAAISKK